MAVTNIPNVQNWTVTPQNGQSGYFDLMNTWLGQSTLVIASLQTAITAQNLANVEINTLASQAESNAIIATGLANYQGEYSTLTTYSKSQSVSVGGLYYTSKVDGNSNHLVTDINYWIANPINLKMDKDINSLTVKTTPIDADELVIADSTSTFSLKKLTFSSLKVNLLAYFDNLYSRTSAIFGVNQTWKLAEITNTGALFPDGTAKYRANNVTYTNTTGKPIAISCEASLNSTSLNITLLIDGLEVQAFIIAGFTTNSVRQSVFAIIPPGSTYKITTTGSVLVWAELR